MTTNQEQPAIVVDDVSRTFRSFWGRRVVTAVDGLKLEVPRGCIFGLLGPNGSGKTTTLSMILGLLRPDAGLIRVLGESPGSPEVRGKIGYLPEEFEPPEYLSGEEVLRFYGGLQAMDPQTLTSRIDSLLGTLGLEEARARRFREYSKGMRRRIGLAQALLHEPELLILDEPTNGLDPIGVGRVRGLIQECKARGCTVLLSSHILPEVEEICESIALLREGSAICAGATEELLSSKDEMEVVLRSCGFERAAEAAALLRDKGFQVDSVRAGRRSLESLFLELVDEE